MPSNRCFLSRKMLDVSQGTTKAGVGETLTAARLSSGRTPRALTDYGRATPFMLFAGSAPINKLKKAAEARVH